MLTGLTDMFVTVKMDTVEFAVNQVSFAFTFPTYIA